MARAAITRGRGITHTNTLTHTPWAAHDDRRCWMRRRTTVLLESARARRGEKILRRKRLGFSCFEAPARHSQTPMRSLACAWRGRHYLLLIVRRKRLRCYCRRRRPKRQFRYPRVDRRRRTRRGAGDVQAAQSPIVSERQAPTHYPGHHAWKFCRREQIAASTLAP